MIYHISARANKPSTQYRNYNQILYIFDENYKHVLTVDYCLSFSKKPKDQHYCEEFQSKDINASSPIEAVYKYQKWLNSGLDNNYLLSVNI